MVASMVAITKTFSRKTFDCFQNFHLIVICYFQPVQNLINLNLCLYYIRISQCVRCYYENILEHEQLEV